MRSWAILHVLHLSSQTRQLFSSRCTRTRGCSSRKYITSVSGSADVPLWCVHLIQTCVTLQGARRVYAMNSGHIRHALTALVTLYSIGSLTCHAQSSSADITFVSTAQELQQAAVGGAKHIVITEHIDFTAEDIQIDETASPNAAALVPGVSTLSLSVRICCSAIAPSLAAAAYQCANKVSQTKPFPSAQVTMYQRCLLCVANGWRPTSTTSHREFCSRQDVHDCRAVDTESSHTVD